MRRYGSRIGLSFAGVLWAAGAAAQTVEASERKPFEVGELIAKNIEARGGLEKIKAVQSMRMTGTMSIGDTRMPSILEMKRPKKTRFEFTLEGQTAVQAYDGKTAWVVLPFAGKTEPEQASAEDAKDLAVEADMDGPLVDSQAKGNRVELSGREKIHDRDAWKLKVTLANGDVRDVYLDAKTYLQFLTVTQRMIEGKPMEIENAVGDYREVGGILLPHSFETRAKGLAQKQSIQFDRTELNPPIDDSRFQMPPARKPAERPEPAPTPAAPAPAGKKPVTPLA